MVSGYTPSLPYPDKHTIGMLWALQASCQATHWAKLCLWCRQLTVSCPQLLADGAAPLPAMRAVARLQGCWAGWYDAKGKQPLLGQAEWGVHVQGTQDQ